MDRLSLIAVGILGAVGPAWAGGTATLSEGRDLQVIRARGAAPGAGPYVARLRGHGATALETPVEVVDGAVSVELLTGRRLLPGRYTVELVAAGGDSAALVWDLRLGDPGTQAAALDRHRVWLQRAVGTVRELSASLEQRAGYHQARIQADPAQREAERDTFEEAFFLATWRPTLLGARMDMQTYGRRLLLPPLPEASAAILDLLAELGERAEQWRGALETGSQPPARSPQVEQQRRRLLEALGIDLAELRFWEPGPLASLPPWPPALDAERVYVDRALGFRLQLPSGFEPRPTSRPDDRFLAVGPQDTNLLVQVMEQPDARDADALRAAVEVANWEGFLAYKRGAVEPLADGPGVRITFRASAADLASAEQTVAAVQIARFDLAQRRVISLIVFHPAGGDAAGLEQVAASFQLEQP